MEQRKFFDKIQIIYNKNKTEVKLPLFCCVSEYFTAKKLYIQCKMKRIGIYLSLIIQLK